jgi:hypothetical protein
MHPRVSDTIAYLESENTPSIDLSVFKEQQQKRIIDIQSIADRAEDAKKIQPQKPIKKVNSPVVDGNIERKVRPLHVDLIMKKEKEITWL